jgi:hypothetical protein
VKERSETGLYIIIIIIIIMYCFCNLPPECLLGMLINMKLIKLNRFMPFNDAALTEHLFPDATENAGENVVIRI